MRQYNYTAVLVVVLVLALAGNVLAKGTVPVGTGAGPATTTTMPQKCYTANDLVTLTVAEAWQLSGKNYGTMVKFVRLLASVSAQKRGLSIPDTKEAGTEIGKLIRQKAEADPNQLLYVVVDSSLMEYAVRHK